MLRTGLSAFVATAVLLGAAQAAQPRRLEDAGEPFGSLPVVDAVRCGAPGEPHPFVEEPKGISKVETLLGRPCRVLPNAGGAKYFAYRVGQGKGLKAGRAYLLRVDFPEDKPRTMFLVNRGAETARGVCTGAALGDVLYTYTNNNCESLQIPLSQKHRSWKTLFFLHDRFPGLEQPRGVGPRPMKPQDGFWVIIAQSRAANAPLSAGAAVSRISLYEVPDPSKYSVPLRLPPNGLPRRHLFWREEMSDGVVASRKAAERGVDNETDWFEHQARLMRFLGVNTFCKDLLEFGHNQGWDATPGGGNNWYWQSKTPKRWQQILAMLRKHGCGVLPYYEWAGSVGRRGVGARKKCTTLGGQKVYTHISWSEKANADITDPETLADAKKLLDATIVQHKDTARFVGAWFRTRPSNIPMSFSERCLYLFAVEANGKRVATREDLRADEALLEKYRTWWFGKRRAFLIALRDHLRAKGIPEAVVLFTAYGGEPGPSIHGFKKRVVTDDVALWTRLLARPEHAKVSPYSFADAVRGEEYLRAALRPPPTWGKWEWQHSIPQPDPARCADTDGVLMTYPFNRAYTVSSPKPFDAFRGGSGLAVVRHYPLNEGSMEKKLGYFVSDVERAGPFCMLGEARAMAYGDPRYIGYLASSSFTRGFPEYARAFNAAFLSLPALPSKRLRGACSDPEVVVRAIPTDKHGTYLAVVNVGLEAKQGVAISLPARGKLTDAPTGKPLATPGGALRLSLAPCELRALHIQ